MHFIMIKLTDVHIILLLLTMLVLDCSANHTYDEVCQPYGNYMYEYCKVDSLPGLAKFPENEEELEKYCSWSLNRKNCHLSWAMKCMPWLIGNTAIMSEVCEVPSFYEVVKNNAACLYSAYFEHEARNTSCHNRLSDLMEEYFKFNDTGKLANHFPEISELRTWYIYTVYYRFLELGCFLNNLQCPEIEDFVREMQARTYYYLQEFLDEDKENAFAILEFLNFPDEYKKMIKDNVAKYEEKCLQIKCLEYRNKYDHLLENFSWDKLKQT